MNRIQELWAGLSPNGRRGAVAGAVVALLVGVGAAVALSGGGGDGAVAPKATSTTAAPTTTTTAAVTTTTEPPTGPVAPLTGLRVEDAALLARPALAVKVDNLDTPGESAVPQTGLLDADVVFEEVVEGNITRLVGVFHSQAVDRVGPVRSARTTDVHLLPQLQRPLLAWSGGNDGVVQAVRTSPNLIDVGAGAVPGAYARDTSRRAPHNLYVTTDQLWPRAPADSPRPVPLFQYRTSGQAMPASARKAGGVDITWGTTGAPANVSWRWDPKLRLYLRTQRGRSHTDSSGGRLSAKNVVVLVTEYGQSPADLRSPEAISVGSGELFAFTNGRVVHGRWNRPDETKPATLVDDAGAPVLLSPGQTWIELPRTASTTAVMG